MCGRFALFPQPHELLSAFGVEPPSGFAARYNIAPSQPVLTLVEHERERGYEFLSWGLLPGWAKDPAAVRRSINARAETVAEKPSFRAAFKRRRCLVPASGYYEWRQQAGGKQPYFISRADAGVFAIAGIWEYWERDGNVVMSLALLTCAANAALAPVHHRMPVVLAAPDFDAWFAAETPAAVLADLVVPAPESLLTSRAVSRLVNKPANDGPECIAAEVVNAD